MCVCLFHIGRGVDEAGIKSEMLAGEWGAEGQEGGAGRLKKERRQSVANCGWRSVHRRGAWEWNVPRLAEHDYRRPGVVTLAPVADWFRTGEGRKSGGRGRCRHLWNENVTNGPRAGRVNTRFLLFSTNYFSIFSFLLHNCGSLRPVSVI